LCKLRLRAVSEELFVANIHGLTLWFSIWNAFSSCFVGGQ
jgi:hypothetical protein